MAFHIFLAEGIDTAVIECGVGGEYDSTNIITNPSVTGITSLGIDHVAVLGDTIESIAWHKAGIMKPGADCYTVPQSEGALNVLRRRAKVKMVDLHVVQRNPQLDRVKLGLAADFQKSNASLAIAIAAARLKNIGRTDIPSLNDLNLNPLPREFVRGLETVTWGGRCEVRREKNLIWHIDGGHTLESIDGAARWFASQVSGLQRHPTKRILLFNQQTRDANALARGLHHTLSTAIKNDTQQEPFTHAVFCTNRTFLKTGYRPDLVSINANSDDIEKLSVQHGLAKTWATLSPDCEVTVKGTIEEAVAWVKSITSNEESDIPCLVTGSLHLVGGFLEVLEQIEWSKQHQ